MSLHQREKSRRPKIITAVNQYARQCSQYEISRKITFAQLNQEKILIGKSSSLARGKSHLLLVACLLIIFQCIQVIDNDLADR